MRFFSKKGFFGIAVIGLTLVGFLTGCGSALNETKKEEPATTSPKVSTKSGMPNARYYDFEDIQIPNELAMNADKSKIFQTTNMTAGVLSLDGNVEVNSLIAFFKASMAKDNWVMKGNFKLPPKSVLLFEKKGKNSIILIDEGTFSTKVEIWSIPISEAGK
ncbi:MAG: hypothetical protein HY892_01570 [Deltaproteobacteria bacterium]|nr:hypothetical protein [Deltaproteobacteria bacterium]